MADFIGVDITGNKELARLLENLPEEVMDANVNAVSDYLIEVLKQYPPPKQVTRKQAYGRTFESDKQRRWFFWRFRFVLFYNQPFYRRTQRLRKGWKQVGKGIKSIIVNEVDYAEYVMGSRQQQSRMMTIIGWSRVDEVLTDRWERVERILYATTKKELKRLGLT